MASALLQHPNVYTDKLGEQKGREEERAAYLAEITTRLSRAVADTDIQQCVVWCVNLHKFVILYGLAFTRQQHVYLIKLLYGLLTTKNTDPTSLDKFAKVLYALIKKKYLIPRSELELDWLPLFELHQFWEDSSLALRGLLKAPAGFKLQIKSVIKVCRGYFSSSSTGAMLARWRPLLCPADRSMSTATRYLSLFLPTTKDIPAEQSWQLWLPLLQSYWQSWSNSPGWEIDLLKLYSRLASHRVGQVDWEPLMLDLYTRFMASFNLPVTYGGSGLHLKHGISGASCVGPITKWIVSTLGGGSSSQQHLTSMLGAIQSYYHPANSNASSEQLHIFISSLCTHFVDRLHLERHNNKWQTKIPPDKRLTDQDVETFVAGVSPVAWLVLYNNYEEEARSVFSSLALLAPHSIIPPLLDTLQTAAAVLTEPHRLHVCIQAVAATAGPLVRHYPVRAVQLLHRLLPALDVNDMWRSTDIFVCMSDLLELMPVAAAPDGTELGDLTARFEDFVSEFIGKCFTLIENSRRENFRSDSGNADEYLNDEEIAADAAINDTFLRLCINASPEILELVTSRLTAHISGLIVEPTVAGGILASMCKSAVLCAPQLGLQRFLPPLVSCVLMRVDELALHREAGGGPGPADEELQFNLQLLGEVLCCRQGGVWRSHGSHLLPWLERICSVLDGTLGLAQKDEYELGQAVLGNTLAWLCSVRQVEVGPRVRPGTWAQYQPVQQLQVNWYVPGQQELTVVDGLLQRYLAPAISTLRQYSSGALQLDKETLQRNLRLVQKVLAGVSELAEPELEACGWESVGNSALAWLHPLSIQLEGRPLRAVLNTVIGGVQDRLAEDLSDDTESLAGLLYVYDSLLFSYGQDEDDIGDHIEDHKREKQHREDRLVRGKIALPGVHLDRVALQWETHVWLANLLVLESAPRDLLERVFRLCVHRYSEVRVVAQELLLKVVARVGPTCHPLLLPSIVRCLGPDTADSDDSREERENRLKGALYLINSEKQMFFYSWEAASQLWPALVTAQHSDKQSVDDLLRDIGIKANRYYQDYALHTLPLSQSLPPTGLQDLARPHAGPARTAASLAGPASLSSQVHYEELESRLVGLVTSNAAMHWRHCEMAVGMLLSMLTYDHAPSLPATQLWLSLLLSDQRTLRLMAYQALEGTLKLAKLPSNKVPLASLLQESSQGACKPGVRQDNALLQYRGVLGQAELQQLWAKPFIVKSYLGYAGWPGEGKVRLTHSQLSFASEPASVRGLVAAFFLDESNVKTFVEYNSLEYEKGQDFFSTDRGLFLSFLVENIGPGLSLAFQPHIERLVSSPEESQQRAAAEMVYGLVRGARFWDWEASSQLWHWLLPVFQQVLNNVTAETQSDWDFCFSGVSNKADPNRLRFLYELLITPENLVSQGSFKESSYLLFVSKCLSMNWRVQELYCRAYNILREHWAHPFQAVRHQIAATLATLTSMDIPWAGPGAKQGDNIGEGFPSKKLFIDEVVPLLSLNCPNPEFSGSRSLSPSSSINTSHSSSEDVSMAEPGEDEESKRGKRTLEMVSLWICHSIRLSSARVDPSMFELLPYLCQFIGTESDQDVSQSCLQALSYLSVSILPGPALAPLLTMLARCLTSSSYKTKLSTMEFLQVSVFTNFPSLVASTEQRSRVTSLVTSLLSDPHITVRQKAAKILGGLLHSGFVSGAALSSLLGELRARVRARMSRQPGRKFRREENGGLTVPAGESLVQLHSGILGICAFVEAFPYDVPEFVPPILMELSTHLNDPQPVPLTIKKCLQEFKRTHQDNWQEHKTKFTDDQLVIMTDLLVSHNYYA